MAEVAVSLRNRSILVKINGSLHLRIQTADLLLIHSWHYDTNYFIEFTFRSTTPVLVEHDSREIWLEILAGLEKVEW